VHHLSKLTTFLFEPTYWVAATLLLGCVLLFFRNDGTKRWGRRFCVLSACLLVFLSWSGLPKTLIANDEVQYSVPSDPSMYHGVIVLGGAIASPRIRSSALPSLACAAERVIEPIYLMSHHPHFKMLFTGGDARLIDELTPESNYARELFLGLGVDLDRVTFESKSRNTFENAVLSRNVAGVDPKQSWLLLTSAWHMTRAKATFERAGWNIVPYPVDFFSQAEVSIGEFSFEDGANAWRLLLRERIGLIVYRLLGRA
jgi:uncharacterized SAM-binding protein YcdF (DUF218 family)